MIYINKVCLFSFIEKVIKFSDLNNYQLLL